jgi:hypothetical protein
MLFKNLIKHKNGRKMMSILWGLGLAALFKTVCKGRDCIIYTSNSPLKIKKKIYKHNEKCYKYDTEFTKCDENPIEHII